MAAIFKGKNIRRFTSTIISGVIVAIIVAVLLGDYKWKDGKFLKAGHEVPENTTYTGSSNPHHGSKEGPTILIDPASIVPIKKLFEAWDNLDLGLYMSQWAKDGIQHSKKFKPRGYGEIMKNRQNLFNKLDKVTIHYYKITKTEQTNQNTVSVDIQYSMSYYLLTGQIIHERDVLEKYLLVKDKASNTWLIQSNFDYIE